MPVVEITCLPHQLEDKALLEQKIKVQAQGIEYAGYQLIRRWIDARGKYVKYGLRYNLILKNQDNQEPTTQNYRHASADAIPVHIIGAGPAGYFAALECLLHGMKPIVIEQGKDVQSRRRDLRAIQQDGLVNPLSNYCFGEGGAGTYSDGKLYTRAKKRGNIQKILDVLIAHGAPPAIGIDAHPHIGSNKLPKIIAKIRGTIETYGGQIRFDSKVTDLDVVQNRIQTIQINHSEKVKVQHVILATGHSARDVYSLFQSNKWKLEAKPFALGMRIEHPQPLIDQMQYGTVSRGPYLPAAAYALACEIDDRGVFSFCMCPGGLIVPAATAPGELVVNGMSLSRRDSPYANSGFVVSIEPQDIDGDPMDPMICMEFQRKIEQKMFALGDGSQAAPAQRVHDFIAGKLSKTLPPSSYIPGIYSARLDQVFPDFIVDRIKRALAVFNHKLKGRYLHPDAIFVGVESRTSAPVRIPREPDTMMHPQIDGLYPCGEGAGYAGGIMSAAIDGQRVVESISSGVNVK